MSFEQNPKKNSMVAQSLIFSKGSFTKAQARAWCKKHGGMKKVEFDETKNTYRVRLIDPDEIRENSFRTIKLKTGLKVVIGKRKQRRNPLALYAEGFDERSDSNYDPKELALGIQVEYEHTGDYEIAKKIAKDHLDEIPNYYSLLIAMEKKEKNPIEDYMEGHTAPEPGEGSAPMWDLRGVYPDDVYSYDAARLYSSGSDFDSEAFSIVRHAKGRRDLFVTIYRAVPKDIKKINRGDWVTITRGYAKEHGESNLDGKFKILRMRVHARDLFTDGNSIQEWGYHPQPHTPYFERDKDFERWAGKERHLEIMKLRELEGKKQNPKRTFGKFSNTRPRTPDEHCSLAFLRHLQKNNYISEMGVEYCAEEVDHLAHIKASRRYDAIEARAKKETKNRQKFEEEELEREYALHCDGYEYDGEPEIIEEDE